MSFNVTLSIPTNFNDNYVKKGGQANNANANGNENVNDTDNANVGGQIINDFRPVQNIIDGQLAIGGLMDGFPRNGYDGNQLFDRQFGYFHHDGKPPVQQLAAYPHGNLGYPLYPRSLLGLVVLVDGSTLAAQKPTYVAHEMGEVRPSFLETDKAHILDLSTNHQDFP